MGVKHNILDKSPKAPNVSISPALDAGEIISVRVSPNAYVAAMLLGSFLTLALFYYEQDIWAVTSFVLTYVALPILAFTDRITFDGKRLRRTGILFKFFAFATAARDRLRLNDIEQVDTQSIRSINRGGRVKYRYRTTIHGRGMGLSFVSGGENYRRMLIAVLSGLPDTVLDTRSIDLRDYLSDPKEVEMKASFAGIPRAEVLHASFVEFRRKTYKPINCDTDISPVEGDKAKYLQHLGNELRVAGFLLQALESFRRALVISPRNAAIIYDFARTLGSFASAESNLRLKNRSLAALRLAEKYAGEDADLLARLGETYLQFDQPIRAMAIFRRCVSAIGDAAFLAARGLAEIALREGKIAHVIHNFSKANEIAGTASLRRWTSIEAQYFSHLQSDNDYLELEVSRINLLESIGRIHNTSRVIASLSGVPLIFGIFMEEGSIALTGWLMAGVGLAVWVISAVAARFFSARLPYSTYLESRDE